MEGVIVFIESNENEPGLVNIEFIPYNYAITV
jgi:hypothetical protein